MHWPLFRRARPEHTGDIEALSRAAILAGCTTHYDERLLADAVELMSRLDHRLIADRTYCMACQSGRPVACGRWSPNPPAPPAAQSPETAHLRAFFVHPAAMGVGLGRRLVEIAERQARAAGHTRLQVYASLNAEPFYSACGFSVVQNVDLPLTPKLSFPAVLMEKR